ncbi:MAG: DUF1501 domain-containing protein [Planctomycetales bacterium]
MSIERRRGAQPPDPCSIGPRGPLGRRDFLGDLATGLGGIALASLLHRDGLFAADPAAASGPGGAPHHPPRARRVIQIFLAGGLSQVDSFDYKPELEKRQGQHLPGVDRTELFGGEYGPLQQSHFPFRQRGASGQWISDLFPEIAGVADELTFIRSMVSLTADHTPATYEANTGFREAGFPAMGSWLSYGLGSESEDLPAFVVVPDVRSQPDGGPSNWSSAFLPARHQGVVFRAGGTPVRDLAASKPLSEEARAARFAMLAEMNRRHLAERAGEDALAARIRSYELAARMQVAVPEATDLARETAATHRLYGTERAECADFARGCLMSRRLLERGVRFVQLWSGGRLGARHGWDAHEHVPTNHATQAVRIDRPVAGLLRDLKERGLLEDTLVVFNTEFGRTPITQSETEGQLGFGRNHNPHGFSIWMAGAGLKRGHSHGATDEFGFKAIDKPVTPHDFHATVLHLLGIDHKRLTYYHSGIERRLTDVAGNVVSDLLA